MNLQSKSLLLSIAVHGILAGACIVISSSIARENPPVVIDFSVLGGADPTPPGPKKEQKKAESPRPKPQIAQPKVKPVIERPRIIQTFATPASPAPATAATGVVPMAAPSGNIVSQASPEPVGTTQGSGSGAKGGSGSGSGSGSGDSVEQLKNKYRSQHFEYIKNLIQKNVAYPPRAKKMGWTGKVVVSFVILENGHVTREKIVTSSGFDLLDDNVLATIKNVEPFPKPPVKAELKIPIVYTLQ